VTSAKRGGRITRTFGLQETRKLLLLGLAIWILFLLYSVSKTMLVSAGVMASNVIEVNDPRGLYSSIPKDGVAILYFKQELCPGCAKVEPALLRYVRESANVKLVIASLDNMLRKDARATLEVLGDFKVLGTPTLIVYVNGREVGRHVSTFGYGDQYEPLKKFVEDSVAGRESNAVETGLYTGVSLPSERAFNPGYIIASAMTALGLGLIAAFSPCSLPMIAAYSLSSSSRGFSSLRILHEALSLGSIALLGGSLIVLVYLASTLSPINLYKLVTSLAASLLVAWGLLTLVERRHVTLYIPGLRKALPLLGIQCSLPFLVAMLALLEAAPHVMLLGSMAFALGYITPYLAVTSSLDLAKGLEAIMRSKVLLVLQGLALIVAGSYTLYNIKSII
jgi:hypothetical protein